MTAQRQTSKRPPYGPCPACEGSGRIVLMLGQQPTPRRCNVCEGAGQLDEFGCPAKTTQRAA